MGWVLIEEGTKQGLKVRQLIEYLKTFDQELEVIVDGYEGGTSPLTKNHIATVYVDTSAGEDWFGDYGDESDSPANMETPIQAILLRR